MQSITLQTSDSSISVNEILGRLGFAASSESDGSDSILVAAMVKAVAEGDFTQTSNATSLVFSTALSSTASDKLKITSEGHFVPFASGQYDLGSPSYHFRNIYADNIIGDYSGQLDGNLDLNGYDIVGTGNITIDGNVTAEYFYGDLDGVVITECRNDTGSTIAEGTPVYVAGYYSSNGKPLVAPADCANAAKMPAIGLLASELSTGSEGHVHVFGLAQNLPSAVTNGFSVGNTVYVDNGGGLTNVRPTGVSELVQNIGRVLKTGTNGRILVLGPGRSNDVPNSGHFEQLTVDGHTSLAADGGKVLVGGYHSFSADGISSVSSASTTLSQMQYRLKDNAGGFTYIGRSQPEYSQGLELDGGASYFAGTAGDVLIAAQESDNVKILTGGFASSNVRMTIDPNGKVGIGTSSLSHKLEVKDGSSTGYFDNGFWYSSNTGDAGFNIASKWIMHNDTSEGNTFHLRQGSSTLSTSVLKIGSAAEFYPEITFNDGNGYFDFRIKGLTDSNLFFVDGNNGKVGIGTVSPSAKLNVELGNVAFNSLNGSYTFKVGSTASDNLLYVDGTSNDKVGIGTASPSSKLTVYDDNGFSSFRVESASSYAYSIIKHNSSTQWGYLEFNNDASNRAFVQHNGSNNNNYGGPNSLNIYSYAGPIVFGTNPTVGFVERMRITSSGNVGIGTDSPTAKFEVVDGSSKGFFAGGVWYADHITGNGDSGFVIRSAENNKWSIQNDESEGDTFHIRSGGFGGSSLFKMTSSETVLNEDGNSIDFRVEGDADQNLLFVQGAGGHDNVAIGTNTPLDTAKFQIQNHGSTAKIYSQIIGGHNKGFGLLNNQSVIETLSSVNGFYSYMSSSTNGAVTDMYHFRVDPPSGVGTITNQRGFYVGDGLQYATNNYGFYGYVPSGTNNYNIYMGGSAKNYFNGDVGIGTASPTDKLTVEPANDTTDLTAITMRRNSSWGGSYGNKYLSQTWRDSVNTVAAIGARYDGTSVNLDFHSMYNGTHKTSSDVVMSIHGDGNVGIGTASPATKLHINSEVSDDANYSYDTNSLMVVHQTPTSNTTLNDPKDILYLARQGTSTEAYGAAAAFSLSRYENSSTNSRTRLDIDLAHGQFLNSKTKVMTMRSDGNVGIGTASPSYKLQVEGGDVTFNDDGGTYNFRVEGDADQNLLYVRGSAGVDKVGVGTSSPNGKFSVYYSTTDNSFQYGIHNSANHYTTTGGTNYVFGNYTDVRKYVASGVTDTGYVMGHEIISVLSDEGSLTSAFGLRTYAGINSQSDNGNLTAAYGVQSRVINNSNTSGSINTARGVDVYINGDLTGVGNGGITNAYGVYIQSILNSTNTYGLYQVGSSDKNYFAGDVGIGKPSPSEKLDVNGGIGHVGWKTFRYIDTAGPNGSSNGFAIKLNDAHGTTLNTEYHYRIRLTTDATATTTGATYLVWYKQATSSWQYRVVSWAGSSSNHCILAISGSNAIAYTNDPSASYDIHCVIESYHTSNEYSVLHSMGSDYQWQRYVDTLYYNDGNVGVGTNASVTSRFQVEGGDVAFNQNNGSNIFKVGSTTSDNLLYVDGTSNDKVGIGTASPFYKLDVNGTFSANSINVNDQFTFPTTDGSADQVLVTDGNGVLSWEDQSAVGTVLNETVNGRLTLESGEPVSTTNQTAKTTLYFTPYKGNQIALYDGTAWGIHSFSELSLSLSGYTANTNYDIFVYDNSGTLTLESVAWTNNTTRATSLVTQDGVYVKSGTTTRRYLGTIRTTGTTGQCEDSESSRFIWNYYNQISKKLFAERVFNHSYTSTTIRPWGNITTVGETRYQMVIGLPCFIKNTHRNWSKILYVGLALDSTTSTDSTSTTYNQNTVQLYSHFGSSNFYISSGYHFIQATEHSDHGSGGGYVVTLNGDLPC